MVNYIEVNRKAYNILAQEYDDRKHEIGDDFWLNIYEKIPLSKYDALNVLEIGPGNGRNLGILSKYNEKFDITTIELSENLCEIIRKKYPKVKVINKNILDYHLEGEKFDVIVAIALIHLFPYEEAIKVLKLMKEMLSAIGILVIGTTINAIESEGFYEKEDYHGNIKRFRHKYTKESFENLLDFCGFKIKQPYIVNENSRSKVWYDVVCTKK